MKTHSALVRDDQGGLCVRKFASRAEAFEAEKSREVTPEKPGKGYTTGQVAVKLGVSRQRIIRRCKAGELPFRDEGTAATARRIISARTLKLIQAHGLRGVARMCKAGLCALALAAALAPRTDAAPIRKEGAKATAEVSAAVPMGVRITGHSMMPAMPMGSLYRVEPITMREVRVGDVIIFHDWAHGGLVAHRVIRADGQWWVTKGDANFAEDERRVSAKNLRWRVQNAPAPAQR